MRADHVCLQIYKGCVLYGCLAVKGNTIKTSKSSYCTQRLNPTVVIAVRARVMQVGPADLLAGCNNWQLLPGLYLGSFLLSLGMTKYKWHHTWLAMPNSNS